MIIGRPRSGFPTRLGRLALHAAKGLFPGYFALVMATGVISIATSLLGHATFAMALVLLNWLAYAVLGALLVTRLWVFPRQIAADISSHQRAPGFFTVVAGTCVLGTQTMIVTGATAVATALWYLGLGLWVVVMYTFFTAVTVRANKPSLATGINGAWLIAAVATQSVVVLRCAIGVEVAPLPAVQFFCLAMFMVGCMLYLAIIPLIFYRLTFLDLAARDFGPPYWINMGAVAISALAGSMLILRVPMWPVLQPFEPFLHGFTLFFWSVASWWIPFLLALMAWRYVVRRDRLAYEPQFWGMVFPLGMYTTSTLQMARALDLPFLDPIPRLFVFVAVAAWFATATGLTLELVRGLRAGPGGGVMASR